MLDSSVLKRRLNEISVRTVLSVDGRGFQATTGNARSPSVEIAVRQMTHPNVIFVNKNKAVVLFQLL